MSRSISSAALMIGMAKRGAGSLAEPHLEFEQAA